MSDFRIDQITNQAGTAGPNIAGITTFSSTSGLLMPSGDTFRWMIVDNVVKDGLVLYLDAGNDLSYPGSGTLWRDFSGFGNNGTLVNGPTYSSANGGSIVFDGSNDYVGFGVINFTSGTSITIEVWVKPNSSQNTYANILDYGHSFGGFTIQQDASNTNQYYFAYYNGSSYDVTPTITLNSNSFTHLVFVKSGTSTIGYVNSVNTVSITGSVNFTGSGITFNLGKWHGGREFNGNIASTKIYNRALSATEVSQNFNALRSRYSI
jgi:hypothetical protein